MVLMTAASIRLENQVLRANNLVLDLKMNFSCYSMSNPCTNAADLNICVDLLLAIIYNNNNNNLCIFKCATSPLEVVEVNGANGAAPKCCLSAAG